MAVIVNGASFTWTWRIVSYCWAAQRRQRHRRSVAASGTGSSGSADLREQASSRSSVGARRDRARVRPHRRRAFGQFVKETHEDAPLLTARSGPCEFDLCRTGLPTWAIVGTPWVPQKELSRDCANVKGRPESYVLVGAQSRTPNGSIQRFNAAAMHCG
jgi:hypothetical protein